VHFGTLGIAAPFNSAKLSPVVAKRSGVKMNFVPRTSVGTIRVLALIDPHAATLMRATVLVDSLADEIARVGQAVVHITLQTFGDSAAQSVRRWHGLALRRWRSRCCRSCSPFARNDADAQ
jgi:hypothetical protein